MIFVLLLGIGTGAYAKDFPDSSNHWAKYSIDYVTNEGYFVGTSATAFSPNDSMTRGMFITVLARLEDFNAADYSDTVFSDVSPSAYYGPAVAWGYENGIVAGISAKSFAPNQIITREQICRILCCYYNYKGQTPAIRTTAKTYYKDDAEISSWARDSVYRMQSYGLLVGSAGYFNPTDAATRAECASVVARVCGMFYDTFKTVTAPAQSLVNKNNAGTPQRTVAPSGITSMTEITSPNGYFECTFYCGCYSCNGNWGGTACGGELIPWETLGVNFDTIPRGSWVYLDFISPSLVQYSGYYQATDTGSACRYNPYLVDICVADHNYAPEIGRGQVRVYLCK